MTPYNILYMFWKQIVIGLIIIALGLFIINQFLSYIYKIELLMSPCELCMELGNVCYKPFTLEDLNLSNITIIERIKK